MKKSYEKRLHSAFQPAAIEIIESPPSPLGHISIWIIFIIIISGIIWACVGEVDQIATARGKVVPYGQIKTLQSSDQGVITGIYVEEGDIVKKGDILLKLDSTFSQIDFDTAKKRLKTLILEKELLENEMNGNKNSVSNESQMDANIYAYQLKLREMRREGYLEKKKAYDLEISSAGQSKEKAQMDLKSSQMQRVTLEDQENKLKKLYASGSIAENEYQQKVDQLELMKTQEESAKILILNSETKIEQVRQNLISLKQTYDTELIQMIVEKNKEILEAKSNLDKMQKKYAMHDLEAPVNGRVSGIGAHTIGGVVKPAQSIVTIVPEGTPLIVEASVMNKDIGFIEEGQECDIKLDAFPFQKYGLIRGKITYISPDAFEDERLGYIYKIRIKPEAEYIELTNKNLNMTPGMTTSVEVKLDRRKIIEFFLPAMDYIKDSFKL